VVLNAIPPRLVFFDLVLHPAVQHPDYDGCRADLEYYVLIGDYIDNQCHALLGVVR
jgi:hypothetical protein